MWQFIGFTGFLTFLAMIPWLAPERLPGGLPLPAFLLVGTVLVLTIAPKKRYFFFVLALAGIYDLLAGGSPQHLITYACCAQVPLFWHHKENNPWWFVLIQVTLCLILQELLFYAFTLRYGFWAWHHLLQGLFPYLMMSLALTMILRPLTEFISGFLHYQQFEYHDEVLKGKWG